MNYHENPLISIIVPVYNVEIYLPQCLNSLESQTFKNIEIVLVDDGSTDSSGIICDEYASRHDNVIVIHQDNKGLSVARNVGVKVSTGSYIAFLDSDDWLAPSYVETVLGYLKENDADVVCSRYYTYWEGEGKAEDEINDMDSGVTIFNSSDAIEEICYGSKFGCSAPDKLFVRDLVVDNPFPEGKLYEDLATMYKIIGKCQTVVYTPEKLSYYRRRRGSIINESFSEDHLYIIEAAEEQLEYIKQHFPEKERAGAARCGYVITQIASKILDNSFKSKQIFKDIRVKEKRYIKSMVFNRRVPFKHTIRALAIVGGYNTARMVYFVNDYLKKITGKKL